MPFHIITTSLPNFASCLCCPLRKPSPSPTSTSSDPTPHAIPNMVRKLRSLFAIMARKTCPSVSEKFCIAFRRGDLRVGQRYAHVPESPVPLSTLGHFIVEPIRPPDCVEAEWTAALRPSES